jgi:hypothetical protein
MIILLSSCTAEKVLFTQEYRERIEASDKDNAERLQYYIDRDIELVFRSESSEGAVEEGEAKLMDGLYVYTVSFKKGTPAIAEQDEERMLRVYFEPDRFLYFRNFDGDTHYQLAGRLNNGDFQVKYEGQWLIPEKGAEARLLFIENRELTIQVNRRTVKGLRVE